MSWALCGSVISFSLPGTYRHTRRVFAPTFSVGVFPMCASDECPVPFCVQTLLFSLLVAGVAVCSAASLSAPEADDQDVLLPVAEELDDGDLDGGDLAGAESHYRPHYYRPRYYRSV